MKKHLLLFLTAVCGTGAIAQTVSTSGMPVIELVGSNSVALGSVPCYEMKLIKFTFRNPGTVPVEITKVMSTCPCVRGFPEQAVLQPNEEKVLTVEFNPTIVHGEFKRGLWVHTSDSRQSRILLTLTGEIAPLFFGLPESPLSFRCSGPGGVWTNRFTLTAAETNLFLGAPAYQKSDKVQLAATIATNAQSKGSFDVTLVATALAEGRNTVTMEIPVLGRPSLPPLRLSVLGWIGTELSVMPSQILVFPTEKTQTRHFLVRTSETNVVPSQLTWTPQREGVTVDVRAATPRAGKKPSTLAVTVNITPKAAAELLKEKNAQLTLAYPNYKAVPLTFVPQAAAAPAAPAAP